MLPYATDRKCNLSKLTAGSFVIVKERCRDKCYTILEWKREASMDWVYLLLTVPDDETRIGRVAWKLSSEAPSMLSLLSNNHFQTGRSWDARLNVESD